MLSQLFGTVWCITVPLAMHGLNITQKASYPLLCNTLFGLIVLHYMQTLSSTYEAYLNVI